MTTIENRIVPAPAGAVPEAAADKAPVVPAAAARPTVPAEAGIDTEPAAEADDSVDDDAVEPAEPPLVETDADTDDVDADTDDVDVVVDEVVVGGEIVVDEPDDDVILDTTERAEKSPERKPSRSSQKAPTVQVTPQ